jgi:hypothetical protein
VAKGLASPDEYKRLLAIPFNQGGIFDPGPASAATETGIHAAIPPTTNPATGMPQFNIKDAQVAMVVHKQKMAERVIREIGDCHPTATDFVNKNKAQLRELFGGQGLNRVMQVSAMMRGPTGTLFSVIAANPTAAVTAAMRRANIGDPGALAARAIVDPNLAKLLATRTTRGDLTKSGESRLVAALS